MNRVAIVGASAGGLATAESLRRLGFTGAITLIGGESERPYDRPPLSKEVLTGDVDGSELALRSNSSMDELNLDMRLGLSATSLDASERVVTLQDGSLIDYDIAVVATGVRARTLPNCPARTHTLRTVSDAVRLRAGLKPGRRLVVIGAGFIGAEVAASARAVGVDVTMLESAAVPLALAVGDEVGEFVTDLHRDHGVQIRTGCSVTSIADDAVHLADGTCVPADEVLVAVGSVPNTEWLDSSGLEVSDGVVCNQYSEAADGVYAVGDVARWFNPLFERDMRIEHRTNAAEQGLSVARSILDPTTRRPFAPVPYFWSDQYDSTIRAYGYLRGHDEARVVERSGGEILVAYRHGDRLSGVLAVGKSPKVLRAWRALVATGSQWQSALTAA